MRLRNLVSTHSGALRNQGVTLPDALAHDRLETGISDRFRDHRTAPGRGRGRECSRPGFDLLVYFATGRWAGPDVTFCLQKAVFERKMRCRTPGVYVELSVDGL